jgi:hypothetical protein
MRNEIIPVEHVAQSNRWIRNRKVLLDSDLAALYGVQTKNLNKAVKRNAERFPADFMFQLTPEELRSLRFQFGTSKTRGGPRYRPYAFTEQGVAMLSSVLKSDRAIRVNVAIMRTFVRLRQTLESNRELAQKFSELERRVGKHADEIAAILEAIRQLIALPKQPRREIGFHVREKAPRYRAHKRA